MTKMYRFAFTEPRIAVASMELAAFGTEPVDLEPEPDDPAESGEGREWHPAATRVLSVTRPDMVLAVGERPFMASQEPRQSGRGNGKGIFTSSRQAGHATHSLT
jgi:hypothetical protein